MVDTIAKDVEKGGGEVTQDVLEKADAKAKAKC